MKLNMKAEQLKFLILGAGGLGLALRIALYATGIDGRGLLESGHWAHIAVWILTATAALVLLICCRPITGPEELPNAYPPAVTAALGAFAAMPAEDLHSLPDENGVAEATCRFCDAVYRFSREELELLEQERAKREE